MGQTKDMLNKGLDGQRMHFMYRLDKWDRQTSVMVGQAFGRTNVDWKKISQTNAGDKKVAPKITLLFNLKIEKL
jgi:hypothetical protein